MHRQICRRTQYQNKKGGLNNADERTAQRKGYRDHDEAQYLQALYRRLQNHDKVCFYERFGGYWVYQEPEIEAKMHELEQQYDITVYAITHEFTEFGELWSFLYVSNNGSDNKYACVDSVDGDFICLAYVWNKTDDWCSEFGSVEVRSFGGGLMRIA